MKAKRNRSPANEAQRRWVAKQGPEWRAKNAQYQREYRQKRRAELVALGKTEWTALSDERRGRILEQRRSRYRNGRNVIEREARLRKKYGMTLPDFNRMLAAQGGVCAICFGDAPTGWKVDHDHSTGVVRGILCSLCNTGIGHFRDDPARLLSAERYLQRSRTRRAA